MPRRFQFSLKWLAWLMLCVACFLGGIASQRRQINAMRVMVMAQEDTDKKLDAQMRAVLEELTKAQKKIKELEAGDQPDGIAD
jgi:uncharacterized coiled-coil protein SlyX